MKNDDIQELSPRVEIKRTSRPCPRARPSDIPEKSNYKVRLIWRPSDKPPTDYEIDHSQNLFSYWKNKESENERLLLNQP